MPASHARNVALTPQLASFVDELVAAGSYNSASEVVRDGLRELPRRKHADQLTEVRARIGAGRDQLDRGGGRGGEPAAVSAAFSRRRSSDTATDEDSRLLTGCAGPPHRSIRLQRGPVWRSPSRSLCGAADGTAGGVGRRGRGRWRGRANG